MHIGIALSLLLLWGASAARAQRSTEHGGNRLHTQAGGTDDRAAGPCYDGADAREIRLWTGDAPAAAGDDPCRDIPFLTVYRSARPSGAAILLIPGGGYDRLTDTKEQEPVAQYFSRELGVTTFLLRYRLAQKDGTYRYPVPMLDGQRALRWVRAHSAEFGIAPHRIGVFGFSAGGHLATTLALHRDADFGTTSHDRVDATSARVDFLGLGYPVISMDPAAVPPSGSYRNLLRGFEGRKLEELQDFLSGEKNVTRGTPPVFLFESLDDQRISPRNSTLFVDALHRAGVPVEAHLYPHGEHGAGLAEGIVPEEQWPQAFAAWLAVRP